MPRRRRGWAMNENQGFANQHSPLTISLLEPTLLLLINLQPAHGYTLLNELEKREMGGIHPSVVYRTLRDLEVLEWIESSWDIDKTLGPPRRIYSITKLGKQALTNWKLQLEQHQNSINTLLDSIKPEDQ